MTTASTDLGFIHRFVPASIPGKPPILLLHGTGADETDLLPIGTQVSPGSALLSPRGKVLEHGMPRFFRRVDEGVFDVADLTARTDELAHFVDRARQTYALERPIALGFSNGANIAWSLLLRHPKLLAGAVLLRAMLPFTPPPAPKFDNIPVLMLSGAMDPLVRPDMRDPLADLFKSAGADVTYQVVQGGHGLTQQDLDLMKAWFAAHQS